MLRILVVLLLCVSDVTAGASSSGKKSTSSGTSPPTCPSRTINYITQGLPQLCLTSTWSGPVNTTTAVAPTVDLVRAYPSDAAGENSTSSVLPRAPITPPTSVIDVAVGSSAQLTTQTQAYQTTPKRIATEDEADIETPLGKGNFLSFEEWKIQNLVKNGQSEHVGRHHKDTTTPRRRPASVHNDLDSLGDDTEIDLDFSGFVTEKPGLITSQQGSEDRNAPGFGRDLTEAPHKPARRSKDAGTTCKERFNHASFDCAATILKTNPKASGSSAVLIENKDSYMLNECSIGNKFIILELCGDILIDTIVMANFEFFSSTFREFRVSISDRYPVKAERWQTLGTFEARNTRQVQAFLVENPLIWARYLRIEFLSHYGKEHYCPVSLVRVHGTTMMEDYKHGTEARRSDEEEEDEETTDSIHENLDPEIRAVADGLLREEGINSQAIERLQNRTADEAVFADPQTNGSLPQRDTEDASGICPYNKSLAARRELATLFLHQDICVSDDSPYVATELPIGMPTQSYSGTEASSSLFGERNDGQAHFSSSSLVSATFKASEFSSSQPVTTSDASSKVVTEKDPNISTAHASIAKSSNVTKLENSKSTASATMAQPAIPTIQESFFKSVQKRLQMLESNSSLSLQYIEDQSRILRDAFSKVEQRQLAKTTNFLDYLNSTVLGELRDFRQQYDQLWQSTVIELDNQREQYQRDVLAINTRLGILADELIFQKRMSVLQIVLVLLCLGLVLFSRGAINNYLELPLVQTMLARSPNMRMMITRGLDTPSGSPDSTRPSSAHKQKQPFKIPKSEHPGQPSKASVHDATGLDVAYSPPTPVSSDGRFGTDEGFGGELYGPLWRAESPVSDIVELQRPSSSPPVLPNGEDPTMQTHVSW